MVNEQIMGVVDILDGIKLDNGVPKNVRNKINDAIGCLNNDCDNESLNLSRFLNQLEDIAEDPNIPSYTRVEILNIVGMLGNII